MARKSLRQWVKQHRDLIDSVIRAKAGPLLRIDDHERRMWVLNDEMLYCIARRHNVEV
jgi:hypothetical protein